MFQGSAELARVAALPGQLLGDGLPQIAFAGRSNVGKSSLINALVGRRKLAYTSSSPGKTRQIFYYRLTRVAGSDLYFVDLPGYGYARASKKERAHFKVLVEAYLAGNTALKGCVLLLDPRRPVGEEEISFVSYLRSTGVEPVIVFTKWDKVRPAQRASLLRLRREEFAGTARSFLCASAQSRDGIDQLWKEMHRLLESQKGQKTCPETR